MGLLYLGGPFEVLLGFSPPFSLTLLNPDRNRDQMGKRNKVFWIERFIMNLAGEFSFRGVISIIKSDNYLLCVCVCVGRVKPPVTILSYKSRVIAMTSGNLHTLCLF